MQPDLNRSVLLAVDIEGFSARRDPVEQAILQAPLYAVLTEALGAAGLRGSLWEPGAQDRPSQSWTWLPAPEDSPKAPSPGQGSARDADPRPQASTKLHQPALFVGLGGTGCGAGAELERRLREQLCGPDDGPFPAPQADLYPQVAVNLRPAADAASVFDPRSRDRRRYRCNEARDRAGSANARRVRGLDPVTANSCPARAAVDAGERRRRSRRQRYRLSTGRVASPQADAGPIHTAGLWSLLPPPGGGPPGARRPVTIGPARVP
ncbi:hypothetical protein [Actinoallomurus sp. CA-150999]|uniref:hypothetical protein n=1 Tax=Actinoallomurus sp. CA-150999 TaxID=3239887 RepID=UPI003D8BD2D9